MSHQRSTHAYAQRRVESGPAVPPRTPNRQGGQGINDIVRSLETRWQLGLSVWDKPVSPSSKMGTNADKVYNKIQFLYFSSRSTLTRIVQEFDSHAAEKPSDSERLAYLLKLLTDEVGSPAGRRVSAGRHSPLNNSNKVLLSPLGKRPLNVTSLYLVDALAR